MEFQLTKHGKSRSGKAANPVRNHLFPVSDSSWPTAISRCVTMHTAPRHLPTEQQTPADPAVLKEAAARRTQRAFGTKWSA